MWVINGKENSNNSKNFDTDNLELAKVFNLPLIVVITHLDEMSKDEEIESVYNLKQFLKTLYPDKTPCVIKEMEYAVLFSVP
jgi:GTPase